MAKHQLTEGLFLSPTPAGAYHAVSSDKEESVRVMLRWLLKQKSTPALQMTLVDAWDFLIDSEVDNLELLFQAQRLGFVEGLEKLEEVSEDALEDILPKILPGLSGDAKTLLADSQGFYISACGFDHETAEQLSALSADLASLHERHSGLLHNNLGLGFNAWGIIDAAGNSQVGFWPIFIKEHRFVLVIGGMPQLNQPALTTLIKILSSRYG